jgi:hypothetical protein
MNPPHEVPKRVREGLGYLSIWMSDAHETVPELAAMRYKDLPGIARDAKEHGIDEMAVWRWCHHLEMPIPHRKVLGTAEEWVQAVKEAAPILNVLRSPRVNYNIESSPLAVKKGFADGAYSTSCCANPTAKTAVPSLAKSRRSLPW